MKNLITPFYLNVVKRVSYWLPLVLWAMIAYGFSTFNPTVSIDDLAREYYIGNGNAMISATRWGMILWVKVLSTIQYIPGIDHLLGVVLLLLGAMVLSALLYDISTEKKYSMKYLLFSSLMVTYPLINEIWEYSGANMMVAGNFFLVGMVHLYLLHGNHRIIGTIISGCILSVVASSYETGIFVYITVVFIILFYKYVVQKIEQKEWDWFKEGVTYIAPLVIAILLRIVIGMLLIKIMGLTYGGPGDTAIKWAAQSFLQFIHSIIYYYGLNGLVYFPITIFLAFMVIFLLYCVVTSVSQRRMLPCIIGALIVVSLSGQAILQGSAMPYRTAHTLSVFVGFCGFLFVESIEKNSTRKKGIYQIVLIILLFACHRQAVYLNSVLTLNHLRSENEQAMVYQIGYQLQSEYKDKKVVFVGNYLLGDFISEQVSANDASWNEQLYCKIKSKIASESADKYVSTNVNSVLNWSEVAFGNQNMMEEYFSYCGFDIEVLDDISHDFYYESTEVALESNMNPFEIKDMGDYVIVCIGAL